MMRERKPLSKNEKRFLLGCALLALFYYFCWRAPSEDEMIAKFRERKGEFEQIRMMLEQDKDVAMIGPDWVSAEVGDSNHLTLNVSEDRIALYHSRLRALNLNNARKRDDQVVMEQFGGGLSEGTWGVGYIWSAQPLAPLVKSAYSDRPEVNKCLYSRLEGDWYLYHRRNF